MPTEIINLVPGMLEHRGKTINSFGLDQTGKVSYKFNNQGFRSNYDFDFVPEYAFFGCSLVAGIGVPVEETFASQFPHSQNYGLAGNYSNADVFESIKQFVNSELYRPSVCMAVVWTDRDPKLLNEYYQQLKHVALIHFFCGNVLPYANCYPMATNLDHDVSNTHIGPATHKFISKLLCSLFDRS